jgi:hypothetical protein
LIAGLQHLRICLQYLPILPSFLSNVTGMNAALRGGKTMGQETVERLLGLILTDTHFRRRFFRQTSDELLQFDLLEHERQSLSNLDREAVELLSEKLDPRIVRG